MLPDVDFEEDEDVRHVFNALLSGAMLSGSSYRESLFNAKEVA